MKAVGLYKYLPIEDPQSLVDLDIPQPNTDTTGHDILVAIKAISVNPVDTKVRRGLIPPPPTITEENENTPRILGWDAAGEVVEAGSDCTLFKKGDTVYYAGSISRPLGIANFIWWTNVLLEENQNRSALKKLLLCRLQP